MGVFMAYVALYRKFRPQSFDELVGQEHIKRTLSNQLKSGRIAHAYLFAGPRGTGKTSTAKLFAKAINCANPDGCNPCLKCDACIQATADDNMDIIEIDAASNNGVDNIRDIRDKVIFAPTVGKYKVYVKFYGDSKYKSVETTQNIIVKTSKFDPYTYYDDHNWGLNQEIDDYIEYNYWDEEIYDDPYTYDGEGP